MSRLYHVKMKIESNKVIEKLKSCVFPITTIGKEYSFEILDECSYYIDLAKFYCIRKDLVEEKELTIIERLMVNNLAMWNHHNEFARCNLLDEKGCVILSLMEKDEYPEGLLVSISTMTPDIIYEIALTIKEGENEEKIGYALLNGKKLNLTKAKKIKADKIRQMNKNAYIKGMSFAYNGEYDKAIEILLPLAKNGYEEAYNDLGVCFHNSGDYEKAKKWYEKCECSTAKENLLRLYFHQLIEFEEEKYFGICEELMNQNNEYGYHELFGLYAYGTLVEHDYNKAFSYLLKGIVNCNESNLLIFDLGYAYEYGIGVAKDDSISHMWYERLIDIPKEKVAEYNYALQCYYGKGCEKDLARAIHYFEESAELEYKSAMEHLVELYEKGEYLNKEKYEEYKNKLQSKKIKNR